MTPSIINPFINQLDSKKKDFLDILKNKFEQLHEINEELPTKTPWSSLDINCIKDDPKKMLVVGITLGGILTCALGLISKKPSVRGFGAGCVAVGIYNIIKNKKKDDENNSLVDKVPSTIIPFTKEQLFEEFSLIHNILREKWSEFSNSQKNQLIALIKKMNITPEQKGELESMIISKTLEKFDLSNIVEAFKETVFADNVEGYRTFINSFQNHYEELFQKVYEEQVSKLNELKETIQNFK